MSDIVCICRPSPDFCSKNYTTENAYRSHINSKKHKENEVKAAAKAAQKVASEEGVEEVAPAVQETAAPVEETNVAEEVTKQLAGVSLTVDADATEAEVNQTIDEKIAASRLRLQPSQCLFCPEQSSSLEANLTHMSAAHSFFIPDADYLVDLTGLVTYLGEKIAVGNVCIFCNDKGRNFRTLDAVRKHMLDKGHCKIAYDSEGDRLELSDFYDFSTSYPDGARRRKSKKSRKVPVKVEEDWEDVDDDEEMAEVDEVVEEEAESEIDSDEDTDSDELSDNQVAYGDSPYELVLPSGARIGHRTLRRYYAQSFRPVNNKPQDPDSGAALVRKLLADKNSSLVPTKGGYGAFGSGTEVVKARNRGEAREAGRHVREFRDQKRREDFRTRVGFIHNSQKHFRDPLLQVCLPSCTAKAALKCIFHSDFVRHVSQTLCSAVLAVCIQCLRVL